MSKKVFIKTFGCQMNEYDSDKMADVLGAAQGYTPTQNVDEADLKRSGSEPIINFKFGSDADKPKTDDGKTPFNQLPKFPKQ